MKTVVLGVGNPYASDDAVGIEVTRTLQRRDLDDVDVIECDGEASRMLDAWEGAETVYIVDTVRSGSAPGTIFRVEMANGDDVVLKHSSSDSSHALGVGEAIALARALDRLPAHLIVYGVEGHDFGAGLRLTPEVAEAAASVVERISEEIRAR